MIWRGTRPDLPPSAQWQGPTHSAPAQQGSSATGSTVSCAVAGQPVPLIDLGAVGAAEPVLRAADRGHVEVARHMLTATFTIVVCVVPVADRDLLPGTRLSHAP